MASKLPLFLFVPFAISCGGDDTPHTIKTPDSNMGSGSNTVTDTCKVNPTYTTLSFMGSNANARATEVPANFGSGSNIHYYISWGAMDTVGSDTMVADYVNMDMYAGYGAFTGSDIVAGTYVIANDDTSYPDCGLCVYLQGDYDLAADDGTSDDYLMASSGTVTLTSVSGSAYKATITNADFRRVVVEADGTVTNDDQTDVPCTTHIDTVSFDIPLKQPSSGSGSGSGSGSATGKPFAIHARALHHRHY
jgi:hypothetical protein